MRQISTSTLSNQNIATALLVATYTADADRDFLARVFIDQVAGNGDYLFWLDIQRLGAGSFYRSAITTVAVASGITSVFGSTISVPVKNTDVVRVYVQGLAGDIATPDIITEFWESDPLRPATADRTIAVDASGQVTTGAIANDAITAASLNNDAVTEIQSGLSTFDSAADSVSVDDMQTAALAQFFTTDTGLDYSDAVDGSVVKEVLDGVPPSTLGAATLWSYATRTLTQSAVQVADAVSGATISILRGDTLTASITGLGALTDYVTLDFTVKIDKTAADTTAVIRVRKNLSGLTDGLLTLNGATASTAAWGSITIDDLAAGDITITLSASATRLLVPSNQQVPYDIQMITATAVQTMATGFANISADVTRAVS